MFKWSSLVFNSRRCRFHICGAQSLPIFSRRKMSAARRDHNERGKRWEVPQDTLFIGIFHERICNKTVRSIESQREVCCPSFRTKRLTSLFLFRLKKNPEHRPGLKWMWESYPPIFPWLLNGLYQASRHVKLHHLLKLPFITGQFQHAWRRTLTSNFYR